MLLILICTFFGTAWCHDGSPDLFQDIAYRQEHLDQELRDMLIVVPHPIASLYPRWNHSTIRNLPSDILCRVPLIRLRQMEPEPKFWGTLVRARPFDYLLLDRLLSWFRSSPNRIRFLQGLSDGKANVLPAQTWIKIGRGLNGWWTHWNDLLQELFQEYDGSSFSSYRWLLELDPSAYEPCSNGRPALQRQELCLAKNVKFIAGNEQKRNELARSLLIDFHNLDRREQIFRFRFWNSALQATLNMGSLANQIIPVEVSSHFMFALLPKQLERLWKQKHHETYELDGERQESESLRYRELPILWLLSDIKMNHPSHENFEIEISKYLNITQQIMTSKAHPSRGRLFNEELDSCLNGDSRNFLNDSPQLEAMLVERLCSMSMKDLERVPLELLTNPGLLNALECLNPGQTLVLTNKLLNNLTSELLFELLLIPNPAGIFGLIAPWDLRPHIDNLLDDMELWPIQKLTALSELPPVLASSLLSKIWESNEFDHGGKIAHHLIHGLACHHVNQIPLISIDRLAREFLARLGPGTWINSHQIITCSCLRARLQHFQRLSNQGTSLVTTQLEAISNLSPSNETDGEEELSSASLGRGICLRRSHLFLPSDLSKTASVVVPPLEHQPWHRLHLAKIFPYLAKRDVIKIGEMWKSFGVPLSLSLEDLIQFGPSISLLALERFQMVPEQRKNLSMALKAVIRESHHFQATNDPKVTFELEDHEINPEQRALIEDAFNEIYIKAVKRLVVTANLFPKDMTPLSCRIADMDLFLIFPMSIMSQFYDREIWLEHRNYSMEETLENEVISDTNENETDSVLLAILYKGSKAYSSALVTAEELERAIDFVAQLYGLIMEAYNQKLNSPSSSNWNLVGMSSKVEYKIATEKRRYLDRLKRIFELSDLRSDEVGVILQSRLESEDQKALFHMENLRYQYRLIKSMIQIAKIKAEDLELGDLLMGNGDALEIILNLFPEYHPTEYSSNTTTQIFPTVLHSTWSIPTTTTAVMWTSTNPPPTSKIHQSTPGEILACSFGLLSGEICEKNPVYEDYPRILNKSLANSSGKDPENHDLIIQSLYLTLIQLLNQRVSTVNVSKDDKVYIQLFMDKKKRKFVSFLKMRNVTLEDTSGLEHHFLEQMLDISKTLIQELDLSPGDLGVEHALEYPVIQDLFRGYIFQGVKQNPELHDLIDESMRTAFRWYYVKLSMEQRRILFQIDAMFKQAKKTLKTKPLTRDQIHEIRTLQKKVNKDSAIVAQRYLKINATGQEKQVARILAEMVKAGNLSDIVIDEVNEFALLQKVYIIMRLVQIVDISPQDFSSTLLDQIPQSYLNIMFGKHLEESQVEPPTQNHEDVTQAPKVMGRGIPSDGREDKDVTKSKSKRESERPETAHALESNTLSNIAFFLYHRAVSIASFRKSKGQLSVETIQELNNILANQQRSIVERFRNLGSDEALPSEGQSKLGFVVLHGNLGMDESEAINNEVIKIQLKATKQIILLLNLEPQFFQVNSNFILTSGIKAYLFGKTPSFKSETNSYLNGVNVLYSDIRKVLTRFAHEGKLNSKQTITAKKIINDLNKETVAEMVHILELSRAELHPDNLIKLIQAKTSSETLTSDQQFEIKTVIYEKKLKAIQQFILLLELKQSDLRISGTVPDDLLTYIFNSDGLRALQEAESADVVQFDRLNQAQEDIYGVFCMSCFHRLYSQWKKDHNIDQNDDNTTDDGPPEKRILGGKEGDFIIKSLGFLNDDANDIVVAIDDYDLASNKLMRSLNAEHFPATHTDVGIILHMYQVTANLGANMNLTDIQRRQFNQLLDSQEEMIYSKLPGVIGNATYSVKNGRFGIVVETKDIEEYRKKALEDFIFNFHLSMTKKMIHLLGLKKQDFDESIHIPPSVEEVLFAPMFLNITTKDLGSISAIYDYLKDTVQTRNNLGLMFDHEYEKATRTIDAMNRKIEDRFVPHLGQEMRNLTLARAYHLLERKVDNGRMSREELEQLKSESFVDMIQSLKIVIEILELEESDLPDFGSINFEIMNALFDSMTDSDQAYLELLHERPKIKAELDMGKVERQLQVLRNVAANGRSWGKSNGDSLEDGEVQPIPSLDFNNPIINHAKDSDITPSLGHKRSKRYVIQPWVFSCEDLRSLGVKRAHLSVEMVGAMSLNEIRNCMDIIQNPGPLHLWQGVLNLFNLTHTEQLVLAQKVPELVGMLPEMNEVDNKREFLTKLGRNFQFSTPGLCREGHLLSSNDIEKNVPIPTSDLSSIPCVFFHPCASFARLLKGSSLSLPSVIVNGKNSSLLTLKNAGEIPELKALRRANILYNSDSTRTWECLADLANDDHEDWTPEDVWYDQLFSRHSEDQLSKLCQSGAIRGLNSLKFDIKSADVMARHEQCVDKLAPILRDRVIAARTALKDDDVP
ncbi:hypothetical protein TCAL_06808 [Tigriopus californicus]|uniref:Uncharacterized protein n=1 Tax=Tigriopus californicus TaxID=6832 RepID=A0A553PJH8_TIGCA|nr:hypothetical protein TCAL_06808 [Tigriopus californicus]